MNSIELSTLIRNRRSIFPAMYREEAIDKDIIMQVLENANWAPSHRKAEPWRFKIFQNESLNTLSEYLGQYYKDNTPDDKYSEIKYKKTVGKPLKSGCVIAICMYDDPTHKLPRWEQRAAVACAVQNMWLTCTSLNIGCYWSSPKSMINAGQFLDLGDNEECLGLFYMGYTDVDSLPAKRGDINDKIEWM